MVGIAACLIAGLLVSAEPVPDDNIPAAVRKVLEQQAGKQERVHGAKLSISGTWAYRLDRHGNKESVATELHWAIDYNGPRKPFIVLAPTVSCIGWSGETVIHVVAPQVGGKWAYRKVVRDEIFGRATARVFENFANDKQTGIVSGSIHYGNQLATAFELDSVRVHQQLSRSLYIQLTHRTNDRGDLVPDPLARGIDRSLLNPWHLDSWTGTLHSNIYKSTFEGSP